MNFTYLILLCILIWSLTAQTSELLVTRKSIHREMNHNSSVENRSNGYAGSRPWRNILTPHDHGQLRIAHGTVNIIGWGILFPIGVIIARYFRKLSNDWYSVHILSQLSGFLLGTFGWGLGLSIKNAAKEHSLSTHGILGTVIFAFATLQPDEEHVCRRYWVIYHHVVGYTLIILIITNIFQGIKNQNAPKRWEWIYGAIVGVLGMSSLAMEVLRFRWLFN